MLSLTSQIISLWIRLLGCRFGYFWIQNFGVVLVQRLTYFDRLVLGQKCKVVGDLICGNSWCVIVRLCDVSMNINKVEKRTERLWGIS